MSPHHPSGLVRRAKVLAALLAVLALVIAGRAQGALAQSPAPHNPLTGRWQTPPLTFQVAFISAATPLLGASMGAASASPRPGPSPGGPIPPVVCDALCLQGRNPHYPGAVPGGPYHSVAFLLGDIAVTLPDGWAVSEDSPSELGLLPSAGLAEDDPSFIKVWRDMQPSKDEATVYGVPNTPEAMAAWLEADPDLTVGPPTEGTIGDGIPAIVLDIGIAPDAVNDYVCSTYGPYEHCVDFLTFHLFGEPFGFVDQDRIRLYLSSFEFEGNRHTLVVAVEGQDQATLTGFLPTAQAVIDSIRLETPGAPSPRPSASGL